MSEPASLDNLERMKRLMQAGHACIRVETDEEPYLLDLVREAISELRLEPTWRWTAVRGLQEGLRAVGHSRPDTENAAAALYHGALRGLCAQPAGYAGPSPTVSRLAT